MPCDVMRRACSRTASSTEPADRRRSAGRASCVTCRSDSPHRALAVRVLHPARRLSCQCALDSHKLGDVAAAARRQRAAPEHRAVELAPRRHLGRPVWRVGRRPVAAIHGHHRVKAEGAALSLLLPLLLKCNCKDGLQGKVLTVTRLPYFIFSPRTYTAWTHLI